MAKKRRFWKLLIVNGFRFLYIFSMGESYALGLSFVAFEGVRCME
jgi:hypothetical protein